MASKMVERVARAIWDDREAHQHERCRQTWEQGSETAKRFALDHARAAIEAMREPGKDGREAVQKALTNATTDNPGADCWNWSVGHKAFIDAALA